MLTEYRGVSWSIGGDSSLSGSVLTLPNLIRMYNSNLFGYSTGTGGVTSKQKFIFLTFFIFIFLIFLFLKKVLEQDTIKQFQAQSQATFMTKQ